MNLTTNFTDKEIGVDRLDPKSTIYQMSLLVADNLQAVRDYYKKPVSIHVGYRDEGHNAKVGGVSTSQHLFGEAVDFHVEGVTILDTYNDIRTGKIKMPHKISQLILEESKARPKTWGWVHMGIWTNRFETARKAAGKDGSANQMLVCKGNRYLSYTDSSTEFA